MHDIKTRTVCVRDTAQSEFSKVHCTERNKSLKRTIMKVAQSCDWWNSKNINNLCSLVTDTDIR